MKDAQDTEGGTEVTLDKDTQVTLPEGTQVTTTETPADSAHTVDENPLDHVGDQQPDPWAEKEA